VTRDRLLDLLLALGLFALASALRLRFIEAASADHDALAPFLRAALITTGRDAMPPAPFPESGWAMAWVQLPSLLGASSLTAVFVRRALVAALSAPLAYALVRSQGGSRAGPLLAGGALALSPGLLDTFLSGFKTFDTPLLVLGLSAAALRAPFWGLALAPLLVMVHPHSLAFVPAAVLLAAIGLRAAPTARWALLPPLGLAAGLALPQLLRDWAASADHAGGLLGFLRDRGRAPERWEDLWGGLGVELSGEYGLASGLLYVAPVLGLLSLLRPGADRLGPKARHSLMVALSALSLLGLATTIRYLHGYHTRPLWVLVAVEAGLLVAALPARWGAPLAGLLLVGLARAPAFPLPAVSDVLGRTAVLSEAIAADLAADPPSGPIAVETLNLAPERHALPEGIGLALLLGGLPDEAWLKAPADLPQTRFYLSLTEAPGGLPGPSPLWSEPGTALLRFDGLPALQDWAQSLCLSLPATVQPRRGGATDWLAFVHGDAAAGAPETWLPPCQGRSW
jgi:hypothetical protein